ncbi:effector binding domain-containing protein [Rhodoferax sp.]|uniref:GyrI-like domain-containing protein n=1 Tax=Rhodoferax sp. TaxID=50421 RepID=UPI0025E5A9C7|nr:effector binding domain-containing protein [Rhodoferax sp.]
MTPHLIHRDQPLHLAGITTRTTNAVEFSPATAKIAPLWQRFFSERVAQSVHGYTPQSALYGVYSGYASDAMGAFDLSAAVLATEVPEGLDTVTVPARPYLVFEAQGPMPATVIALWAAVWQYFQGEPAYARRYASDFEEYSGEGRIAISIGVMLP